MRLRSEKLLHFIRDESARGSIPEACSIYEAEIGLSRLKVLLLFDFTNKKPVSVGHGSLELPTILPQTSRLTSTASSS